MVVFDPHDGRSLGIYPPNISADLVISTHNNFTRTAFRSIRGTHKDLVEPIGEFDENGFRFEGLRTESLYDGGVNACCRFCMDGISVLVCGCIGKIPSPDVIERMKGTQIMIVPVGEYSTMPIETVRELIDLVGAHVIVPSEFKMGGISISLSPLQRLLDVCDYDTVYVGSEIDFMSEDLKDYGGGIWIFDCRSEKNESVLDASHLYRRTVVAHERTV